MVLVHHVGRKSGKRSVTPMMYLPDDADPRHRVRVRVQGRCPTNPAWYYNLTTAGRGHAEIGTEEFDVTVTEITGADRDRILRRAGPPRYPGFMNTRRRRRESASFRLAFHRIR